MGGIRAALDLAEAARDVVLIDKGHAIGGLMTHLDRTFPTNNCDLCTLSPHLSESGRDLHIELMTMTRLSEVSGKPGAFKATLTTEPRYIDLKKCTACGDCHRKFPEAVRFTPGLDHRAPTCMRYPQATPQAFSIDMERCTDIDALAASCPSGAIVPNDSVKECVMEFGAIILAPGVELFNPAALDAYGYGLYPNVLTSFEYERILSASGPTGGELLRPSDGKRPKKIAWIQCVGSRGLQKGFAPYCSSACCMFALKEAVVTRQRFHEDTEVAIFYMDMRTLGKDYELYLERAKKDHGVRLLRSRPHGIEPVLDEGALTGDLSIHYVSQGKNAGIHTETFDMVVLSTGFRVSSELKELAEKLGIELNESHFASTGSFSPVSTSRPGIYVCGLFESPKDIPETMIQASAAACCAAGDLSPLRAAGESGAEPAPERDVTGEEPRIGVFICDCGPSIGGIIDLEDMKSFTSSLPGVIVSEAVGHGCSRESLERIERIVRERNLNRVVVGACSPRTHETLFQDTIRRAGLNRHLLEMANLRDQDTWVHTDRPSEAAGKAKELMAMAVSSVRPAHPLVDHTLPLNKDVLVIGGGIAGMSASLGLAEMGYRVYLLERSAKLGGLAQKIKRTLQGEDVQAYLAGLIKRVEENERIRILTQSVVVDHSGVAGMFKTGVQIGPQMHYHPIKHGVTIIATGALENRPARYLLGRHEAVLTQIDFESFLESRCEKAASFQSVVMIQCVGSRDAENPNCSRICCQSAVKNALRFREINPQAQVIVLYRDMRTPKFEEAYYRKAREQKIQFIPYRPDDPPFVDPSAERVLVHFKDPILGRKMDILSDCLVLGTGFIADEESTEDLGSIFHLPRTPDGYFLEEHVKLRPVDLQIPGFFVAGTAHAPKNIRETIAQAQAAAGRALTFLSRDRIDIGAAVAQVESTKCAACLICVRACPFDVPFINDKGRSQIDPAKCHGCGICAGECPAKAIQLMRFEDDQVLAKLDGLFAKVV